MPKGRPLPHTRSMYVHMYIYIYQCTYLMYTYLSLPYFDLVCRISLNHWRLVACSGNDGCCQALVSCDIGAGWQKPSNRGSGSVALAASYCLQPNHLHSTLRECRAEPRPAPIFPVVFINYAGWFSAGSPCWILIIPNM